MDRKSITLDCIGTDFTLAVKKGKECRKILLRWLRVVFAFVLAIIGTSILSSISSGIAENSSSVIYASLIAPLASLAAKIVKHLGAWTIAIDTVIVLIRLIPLLKNKEELFKPYILEIETWKNKEIQFSFTCKEMAPGIFSHKVLFKQENIYDIVLEPSELDFQYILTIQGDADIFDADGNNGQLEKLSFLGFNSKMSLFIIADSVESLKLFFDEYMSESSLPSP